jgi:hypothetical protein
MTRIPAYLVLVLMLSGCFGQPMWPTTSNDPVPVQEHPTLAESLNRRGIGASSTYRLAVFGDQRALADGEFQALVQAIADHEASMTDGPPLVAIIDTGDIVDNGKHSDQFAMLHELLEPVREWPYLVAVGNHELDQDLNFEGRRNFFTFMGDAPGPLFAEARLWYRLDAPNLRLIFLDTNQWVYAPNDDQPWHRTDQLAWLAAQMSEDFDGHTVVSMHHPIVISNKKHRGIASRMWGIQWSDQVLAEMMAPGADLVLTGHTHTFERYRLTDPDGDQFHLVNVSGRPRNSFLWFGAGARRAQDIRGREIEQLIRTGWRRELLEGWKIEQLDGMFDEETEANQWAQITVRPDGPLEIEMFYLVDEGQGGYESRGKFLID